MQTVYKSPSETFIMHILSYNIIIAYRAIGLSHFTKILLISINLLVVYCESVNLIGYITVDYELMVYGKIVARVIVYVTLFQT